VNRARNAHTGKAGAESSNRATGQHLPDKRKRGKDSPGNASPKICIPASERHLPEQTRSRSRNLAKEIANLVKETATATAATASATVTATEHAQEFFEVSTTRAERLKQGAGIGSFMASTKFPEKSLYISAACAIHRNQTLKRLSDTFSSIKLYISCELV
jgi:hypothetical protein